MPIARIKRLISALSTSDRLEAQNRFVLNEMKSLIECYRYAAAGMDQSDAAQTRESFDYQWHEFADGTAMPSDPAFMAGVEAHLCRMLRVEPSWLAGKRVVDVGCGAGRFSRAFLSLGAHVTACDQSEWALARTSEICASFRDRLEVRRVNLLSWDEEANFDLAFSFGVVHHTGNTYLAIRNVCRKVAPGGRLFLMVYGYPETYADYVELNLYHALREELRLEPYERRKQILIERFGREAAHGYFDAVSPRVNDLMGFGELAELLGRLGFGNVQRTVENRNLHVAAERL